jgi:hypothetical protein
MSFSLFPTFPLGFLARLEEEWEKHTKTKDERDKPKIKSANEFEEEIEQTKKGSRKSEKEKNIRDS